MLTWTQGEAEARPPYGQLFAHDAIGERLPGSDVNCYTACGSCGAWVDADCHIENGIWSGTKILTATTDDRVLVWHGVSETTKLP